MSLSKLHKFSGNSNGAIEREEAERLLLRAKKSIVPYFNGYKVEGYFGKHATREDAENAVKYFKRIEDDE
mgnify:CR=1 FL=1